MPQPYCPVHGTSPVWPVHSYVGCCPRSNGLLTQLSGAQSEGLSLRLTNGRDECHADKDEHAAEHMAVHLPLQPAALVTGPTAVEQRLGLVP